MSKIKEAKRSILQIMPAEGWVAVFSDNDDDGTLPDMTHAQLFAWAVVRELDGKKACMQVTGLFIDDEGQICASCWREGFLRYERFDTERPQSVGE
jgi:hypothetical protein